MSAPRSTARKRPTKKAAAAKTIAAPESGAAVLARVNPQRRVESTEVCLRADLVAEFHAEDRKLAEMRQQAASGNRNAGGVVDGDDVKAQARKVRKIEDQIVDAQVTFVFTGMSKDAFRALTDSLPPRKGNQLDQMVGYDRDGVMEALVRESLTSPTFEDCTAEEETGEKCAHTDCGSWQQLVAVINPSEWGELRDTANLANSAVVDAPKSQLASLILDRRSAASQ